MPDRQRLFCIDPGPTQTGYAILEANETGLPTLIQCDKVNNEQVLLLLQEEPQGSTVCFEKVVSFGGKAGQTLFDTCEWSGRFIQIAFDRCMEVVPLKRKTIVASLTGDATHGDTHIRKALVEMLGKEYVSTKLSNDDKRSAYAVGLCYLGIGNHGKLRTRLSRKNV